MHFSFIQHFVSFSTLMLILCKRHPLWVNFKWGMVSNKEASFLERKHQLCRHVRLQMRSKHPRLQAPVSAELLAMNTFLADSPSGMSISASIFLLGIWRALFFSQENRSHEVMVWSPSATGPWSHRKVMPAPSSKRAVQVPQENRAASRELGSMS